MGRHLNDGAEVEGGGVRFRRGLLDCESPESAMESFTAITGVAAAVVRSRFACFDLERYLLKLEGWEDPEDVVLRVALEGAEECEPAEIAWFHATRIPRTTSFRSAGLLPVSQCTSLLWKTLRDVDPEPPTDAEWVSFRQAVETESQGEWSSRYAIKQRLPGPFAFLIREELDHFGETHSVNYFSSSETIKDICHCYEEVFGRDLLLAYQAATQSCVVKFIDRRPVRVMRTVARYLYAHEHGQMAFKCNTCLDSKGIPITPDQITKIEWINQ